MRLTRPIERYVRITQQFLGPAHRGLDLSAVVGTPVYAPCDGVAFAETDTHRTGGFGRYVRIEAHDGAQAVYVYLAHLSDWRVTDGQRVRAGQLVGLSGNTGNSSGAHLHLEVRVGSREPGAAVDPWPLIDWDASSAEEAPVGVPSKLGLHFQGLPPWHVDVVNRSRLGWVKLIDPGGEYPYARPVNVIGRLWLGGDHVEQGYVDRGAAGADAYFDRLRDRYLAAPWVTVWEGPNEPRPYWSDLVNLNAFCARWVERMHGIGLKAAVGSLSVGRPDTDHAPALRGALEVADYLALHEYAQPTMQTDATWLCLRYRRTIAELRAAGCRVPPILITECGIDGGAVTPQREVEKRPGVGWRGFCDWGAYQEQLAWYDTEICRDAEVVAATPFVWGANGDWASFGLEEMHARWVAARHEACAPPDWLPSTDEATLAAVATGDVAQVWRKRRWWNEEAVRALEAGDTARARAILGDLADRDHGLDYAVERLLTA